MTTLSWLYPPTAFLLGVAHALEPGHGKTIMASYLVAIKGRARDAIILGIAATISHTLVIFALAVGTIALGAAFPLDRIQHAIEIAGGVIVVAMGAGMLWQRLRERRTRERHAHEHEHGIPHDHDHGHSHDMPCGRKLTPKELLSFGLSGGLMPCPAALAIFLLAVGQGKPILGLMTVISLSLGLAVTLVAIGLAVCRGFSFVENKLGRKGWIDRLPLLSAALVTLLGVWFLVRTLTGAPHHASAR